MMGERQRRDGRLFYVGLSLEERVPADHPLRRVRAAVDFQFVRQQVESLYGRKGHVSLDPIVVLKMLFLVFYENVRSEREFMRQLPMRLDWLWFLEFDLDSVIPDHSVLSKARRRWGPELFERFFQRVLESCMAAGLVGGQVIHADSTLLKAHADRDRRVSRKLWEQLEQGSLEPAAAAPSAPSRAEHDEDEPGDPPAQDEPGDACDTSASQADASSGRSARHNARWVSATDPDAAVHTRQGVGTILGYRDHRAIDDACGIILATQITSADVDDASQLPSLLDQVQRAVGHDPQAVVGDSMYGTQRNYAQCRERGIRAYLKKRRGRLTPRTSWLNLLPADCRPREGLRLMGRRRTVAEGSFALAHTRMNHRRCRWRRRWRVQIQATLVASVQNILKLIRRQRRRPLSAAAALTAILTTLATRCIGQRSLSGG